MPSFGNLLILTIIAVWAPLLLGLAPRLRVPSVVLEIVAGVVVGVVDRDSTTHPHFRTKLEAIGYGFLIPVFFAASGVQLDLGGLIAAPSALLRVPLFVLALLLVRGLPALLYQPSLGTRSALAVVLLQATSLPFLVAAPQIGVAIGLMTPVTASALICAFALGLGVPRQRPRPAAQTPVSNDHRSPTTPPRRSSRSHLAWSPILRIRGTRRSA
jgi:Kef-type K+ transport system membrane component KefB